MDFAILADNRIKLKESEKNDKNQDFARESTTTKKKKKPQQLWNMKLTVIPIVNGAFGTVTQGLMQGPEDLKIRERVVTIQNTSLLRSVRILRRVLETWEDMLSPKLQ